MGFDPDCQKCPRLVPFLADIRRQYPNYHARPVAPFGVETPDLLIVGLAPGMHGANATGRPFTGDYAGVLLYQTLHHFGFSNQPDATHREDGLALIRCRITNAVKCLPPQNKPTSQEIQACNGYLANELADLRPQAVILALGTIAHKSVLKAKRLKQSAYPFAHNAVHALPDGSTLVDSYHTSRYNLQTGRLTQAMFHQVFDTIQNQLPAHVP